MHRRHFLRSVTGLGLLATGVQGDDITDPSGPDREYYELRRYTLPAGWHTGSYQEPIHTFWKEVALPALNRAGIRPVGVFGPHTGGDSRILYVLLPHPLLESVVTLTSRLLADSEFNAAVHNILKDPPSLSACFHYSSALMRAFTGMPHLNVPRATAERKRRLFNMRTYEGHTPTASRKKIEMFNRGEIQIFQKVGMEPVFFGESLCGPHVPSLTYMVAYESYTHMESMGMTFWNDPEWVKMRERPEYKNIVSKYRSLTLRPTGYSQI